jgi:hypothetical protein
MLARGACGREPTTWRFGFVDLEPGDGFGGGSGDLGNQAVVVVDPPGGVRGFDGQGLSGVDDSDVDPLFGHDQRAAAGDSPLYAYWFGWGLRWRSGGAGHSSSDTDP